MIIHPASQGTPEWAAARLGIPTASQFHRLITAKSHKPSSSADGYMYELLAEWALGESLDGMSSGMMARGNEMEKEAVLWYELREAVEALPVGFCLRDDGKVGASPDRLVGDDGLLEIKCPGPAKQIGYLLGEAADEHKVQMQGQLWVTERQWCDRLSYNPGLPQAVFRQDRDDRFIAILAEIVDAFVVRLDAAKERLGETP